MTDESVWLRHTKHGGHARLAAAAVEAWVALGWALCDEPADPDPALVATVRADDFPQLDEETPTGTDLTTIDDDEEEGNHGRLIG